MPRPTAAQLSYGSVTVVFATLAMLLLSRTGSGLGIAAIGTAALALGLLVAVTVPQPSHAKTTKRAKARSAIRVNQDTVSAAVEAEGLARDDARTLAPRETARRSAAPAERPVNQHSVRR
ncbi:MULTISPECIES: hypothetical protein [unclassified Streptomyces]|jgi:hypothetical protein|uniref:hypothetical protein n=1 Tax=unclassified Streptomyces TaxID=2593676 RepID=UPI00081B9EDC|nr:MULTISPECIES: hypothetical protein [unclassified Streptomyces]MYQ83967.1 hypothetical protein [Streptomyces sp. SID4936]SCD76866.1 hypothetical protein GA0115234_104580 [Streptomyces sp. DvalAA-43]